MDLVSNSNKVLVKIEERNIEKKTDAGIIMISATDTDYNPAVHSDRYGVVHSVPPNLRFDRTPFSTTWETEIELKVGDEVWFDYMNSENCVVLDCDDGNDYKLLEYENIYVAKRDGNILPLNGYCLFSDVKIKAESKFDPTDGDVDPRYGTVSHIAIRNKSYQTSIFNDDMDVEVGDKVLFGHRAQRYYIEEERYMSMGAMYRPIQRRNVAAVMDKDDKIKRLAPKTVMVNPLKENILPSGIIMPMFRKDIPHFKAEVVMSNHTTIKNGDWVLCPKVAPLRYTEDGTEYYLLTEEDIYFTWDE